MKWGKSERDVHFDVDRIGIDAEDGCTAQAGEHDAVGSARSDSQPDWRTFLGNSSSLRSNHCSPRDLDLAEYSRFLRTG